MKNLCEDRRINSNKKGKKMNKAKKETAKKTKASFAVVNSPFVEINGSILNLFHVETAYPFQNGTNVHFKGTEEACHYEIPYSDFKKLIERM